MSLDTKPNKKSEELHGDSGELLDTLQSRESTEIEPGAMARFLDSVYTLFFNYFRTMGLFCMRFSRGVRRRFGAFYQKRLQRHMHRLDMFWLRVRKRISKVYKALLFHFYMFLKFFVDAWHVVKGGFQAHPKKGFLTRLAYALAAFGKGVRNNGRIFLTALNYVMPLIAIGVFATLINYVSNLNYAVSVEYNGEHVGYVQDETVYEQAETKLQERLLYQEGDEAVDSIPNFTVTILKDQQLKTDSELTDTIIQSRAANIVQATGITIDGKFYGAVKDSNTLRSSLNALLDQYKTNEDNKVEFLKEVDLETGLYLQNNIVDENELVQTLTGTTQENVYYTVVSGDTPSEIAQAYDMSTDELVSLNPGILENCFIGQQVLIKKQQPFLQVKSTVVKTYDQAVAYETEYTESSSLYEGMSQVTRQGQNGVASVTAEISYVDGIEIGRNIISSVVTKESVSKKVTKGTAKMPVVSNYSGAAKSSYGLIWPVSGGYISQYFGYHNGIDYAFRGNGYGKPIVAALPGKVIYSGYRGSYGNVVVVDHGNGMETWYAHMSKRIAQAGDTVAQGQQLGNVGSTGRSTGNHLHFEVRINGIRKNPMNYLP